MDKSSADARGNAIYAAAAAELERTGTTALLAEAEAALAAGPSAPVCARLANLLAHVHFNRGDYAAALAACDTWLAADPEQPAARETQLWSLSRLGRHGEVIPLAQALLAGTPDNFAARSALTLAFARTGQIERARDEGRATLALKAASAEGPAHDLSDCPVPDFDAANRGANIIAFSLFGTAERYRTGALRNVEAARTIYPEWTCRFYIDAGLGPEWRGRLTAAGAQLREVAGLPAARFGTFWRFLVADDPAVDRYLVRDCDACVNLRERAAVEDWIASDKHFHLMRDAISHTELMLAGMWGGVRGAAPPMAEQIVDFAASAPLSRTADQQFLRERIWPIAARSVLAHDSQFGFAGAVDFPPRAAIPGLRVGMAVSG